MLNTILNEIFIEQSSHDWYRNTGPDYRLQFGKIYHQDLHHWWHWHIAPKWAYHKDYNSDWAHFYTALHNPPSEKIVNFHYYYPGGGQSQLWAYIKRYNRT